MTRARPASRWWGRGPPEDGPGSCSIYTLDLHEQLAQCLGCTQCGTQLVFSLHGEKTSLQNGQVVTENCHGPVV